MPGAFCFNLACCTGKPGNQQVLLILSNETISSTCFKRGENYGQILQVCTNGWRSCLPGEKCAVFLSCERGGKVIVAWFWGNTPLCCRNSTFLLALHLEIIVTLSQNEQMGEILDVKLWGRMATRHIGSCAVVAKVVVISRAAGLPTVSFLGCVPLGFILLCLVVVSHCSTFFWFWTLSMSTGMNSFSEVNLYESFFYIF